MVRFEVHATPGSSRPGPDGYHDGVPRLRLSSAPTGGAANAEAERALSQLLGAKVRLVGGGRSRRKTFEVDLDAGELERRLRATFAQRD